VKKTQTKGMYIELIRQKESIKTRQIVMEDQLYPMKQLKS